MKKASQYKNLYQLTRQLRESKASDKKQPINADDSLDKICIENKQPRKNSHSRSNSCPFSRNQKPIERVIISPHLQIEQQSTVKSHKKPLKKKTILHKQSNSQISQSTHTVIVHNMPVEQLSSMLYNRNQETPKKNNSMMRQKKLQSDVYFSTKLQQQMRIYQLNQDLVKVQKESSDIFIKQTILESLARKFDVEIVDINDSFLYQ